MKQMRRFAKAFQSVEFIAVISGVAVRGCSRRAKVKPNEALKTAQNPAGISKVDDSPTYKKVDSEALPRYET